EDFKRPAARRRLAEHHAQRRRLARAVRAEDTEATPGGDGEVDAAHDLARVETFYQPARADHRRRGRAACLIDHVRARAIRTRSDAAVLPVRESARGR